MTATRTSTAPAAPPGKRIAGRQDQCSRAVSGRSVLVISPSFTTPGVQSVARPARGSRVGVALVNIRSHTEEIRSVMLDAIRRIVTAECQASGSPRDAEFEIYDRSPVTDNDDATAAQVAEAFMGLFGGRALSIQPLPASEDFGEIPTAFGVPYTYRPIGGTDPSRFGAPEQAGRVIQDIPVNHYAAFAQVLQPTLDTGTQALVVAALSSL
jgi:metal-dependent amidase/aminoacylase/carboxypeptidase family protein